MKTNLRSLSSDCENDRWVETHPTKYMLRTAALSTFAIAIVLVSGCGRTIEPEATHVEASLTQRSETEVPRQKLELGEPTDLMNETRTDVLISSGEVAPSCTVEVDGVPFTVGARDGRVVFVGCNTEGFKLPGGEVLGVTRFSDLTDSQREDVIEEPGFAFYTGSKDGWRLAWNESPADDDVVVWAFKRGSN